MNEHDELARYISCRIKELRESAGWSQSELARQSGVTSAAICQIEKGNRIPSILVINKLSASLKVNTARLIDRTYCHDSNDYVEQAHKFFIKFGGLNNLNDDNQRLILFLARRLSEL